LLAEGRMTERASHRSERRRVRRAIVIGNGVSGMSTALELARLGVPVLMIGRGAAIRSPSVCSREGMSAALAVGPGDDAVDHFAETIVAGDYAANQPPVLAMAQAAGELLRELDRAGVPFERSPEGRVSRERGAGCSHPRVAHAGACTAQHVLRALDRRLLALQRQEAPDGRGLGVPGEPLVQRLIGWEFLGIVLDHNGVCVGAVATELRSGKVRAFIGDAVCLASGGYGALWSRTTAAVWEDGAAIASVFRRGAALANPEYVAWQPTAALGCDVAHGIPELVRVLGGRVWSPKDAAAGGAREESERDYFLERTLPGLQGLLFADDAARAISRAERRGAADGSVLLDLARVDRVRVSDLCEALARLGLDPMREPVPIVAAVEASLGGLWVDYETDASDQLLLDSPRNQSTNLPGLYAAGRAQYQFHGANQLAGNALTASLFSGRLAARGMVAYRRALARSAFDLPGSVFEKAETSEQELFESRTTSVNGEAENPFVLRDRLAMLIWSRCGIERGDDELDVLLAELEDFGQRCERAATDPAPAAPAARLCRALPDLVLLARAVALGARQRAECRGGHYKPLLDRSRGAPERGAPTTTLVLYDPARGVRAVEAFEYACAGRPIEVGAAVDTRLLAAGTRQARPRAASAELEIGR
jgi:succinate dehydrogenase / fumarate reductase, flavoprotein subunit